MPILVKTMAGAGGQALRDDPRKPGNCWTASRSWCAPGQLYEPWVLQGIQAAAPGLQSVCSKSVSEELLATAVNLPVGSAHDLYGSGLAQTNSR